MHQQQLARSVGFVAWHMERKAAIHVRSIVNKVSATSEKAAFAGLHTRLEVSTVAERRPTTNDQK